MLGCTEVCGLLDMRCGSRAGPLLSRDGVTNGWTRVRPWNQSSSRLGALDLKYRYIRLGEYCRVGSCNSAMSRWRASRSARLRAKSN